MNELAKFDDVDVHRAAQDEENDRGDAQVNDDGDEDADEDRNFHHHTRLALEEVVCVVYRSKVKRRQCCIVWEGGSHMLRWFLQKTSQGKNDA